MKRAYLLIPFLLLFGCSDNDDEAPTLPPFGLLKDNKIIIGNEERNFLLYVPENQENSPLVFLLHGKSDNGVDLIGAGDPERITPYKRWIALADENNLILVAPDGGTDAADVRGWNDCRGDGTGNPEFDDVAFIVGIKEKLATTYSIDNNRIYANGTSNGGHLAIRLTQEASEEFTAVAAVIAAMPAASECGTSSKPISVLFMNGTEDPILPYSGGDMAFDRGSVASTEGSVAYWIDRNQTDTDATYTAFEDLDPNDGSTAEKFLYKNGLNNTEVVLYRINNGGHTEPSISERYRNIFTLVVGSQNGDIEMADEIWFFFKDKSN